MTRSANVIIDSTMQGNTLELGYTCRVGGKEYRVVSFYYVKNSHRCTCISMFTLSFWHLGGFAFCNLYMV